MPTAIVKKYGRQTARHAYIDILLANLATGVDYPVIELPAGAIVVGGAISCTEVFNSTTSDVLDVGDLVSENRYKNDANLQALGYTVLVPTGYVVPATANVTIRWVSGGGVPTTGKFTLMVSYIVRGFADTGPQGGGVS